MKSRIKNILFLLSGLACIGLICYGGFVLIRLIFKTLLKINPNLSIALIAGFTTVLASTLTIVIGRYFEANRDRKAVHRDKKIELYNEFLIKLFEIFTGDENQKKHEDLVPFLREIQRKIILWSGPDVIKSYTDWHKELTSHGDKPRANAMIKMMDFFLALRKDLGHSNIGIKHEQLLRFMLKKPDLFMKMYSNNHEVTMEEISQIEKELLNKTSKST
jgi:hypothetical protein